MRYWLPLALWLIAGSVQAQNDLVARAEAAVTRLQTAQAGLDVAEGREDRVAALTQAVQAYEVALTTVRAGLQDVVLRRRALEAQLAPQTAQTSQLMGVLIEMRRTPVPALQVHPAGPLGTARAAMFLDEVRRGAQADIDDLADEMALLRQLSRVQEDTLEVLEQGHAQVTEARLALTTAISERTDLPRRFREDPVQTAVLMAATDTLDLFANNIADMVASELGGAVPNARDAKGTMPLPVVGEVTVGYRADAVDSAPRPGWIISAPAGSLVTTPVAATLRFQGELLDFGSVVILEPAPDVLFILTGLSEAYGAAGQILPAGAVVGVMPGDSPSIDDIVSQIVSGDVGTQTRPLYLEVREGQSAVDPRDWFAAVKN